MVDQCDDKSSGDYGLSALPSLTCHELSLLTPCPFSLLVEMTILNHAFSNYVTSAFIFIAGIDATITHPVIELATS